MTVDAVAGFRGGGGPLAIRLRKGKVRHVILTDEGQEVFQNWAADRPGADRVFLRADGKAGGASHQKRPLDEASGRAGIHQPSISISCGIAALRISR